DQGQRDESGLRGDARWLRQAFRSHAQQAKGLMSTTTDDVGTFRGPVDPRTRPQDDLFGHVNNHWLDRVEIPADRGRYGVFDVLRERAEEDVRAIIEEVGAQPAADATSVAGKVGALYRSFLDEERAEELGSEPVRDLLAAV